MSQLDKKDQVESCQSYQRYCQAVKKLISDAPFISQITLPFNDYITYINNISNLMSYYDKTNLIESLSKFRIYSWVAWKGRAEYKNKYVTNPDSGHEYQIHLYKEYYNKAKIAHKILTFKPREEEKLELSVEDDSIEDIEIPVMSEIKEDDTIFWKQCSLISKKKDDKQILKHLDETIKDEKIKLFQQITKVHLICWSIFVELGSPCEIKKFKVFLKALFKKIKLDSKLTVKLIASLDFRSGYSKCFLFKSWFEDSYISTMECDILFTYLHMGKTVLKEMVPMNQGSIIVLLARVILLELTEETFSVIEMFMKYLRKNTTISVQIKLIDKILAYKKEHSTHENKGSKSLDKINNLCKMIDVVKIISKYVNVPVMAQLQTYSSLSKLIFNDVVVLLPDPHPDINIVPARMITGDKLEPNDPINIPQLAHLDDIGHPKADIAECRFVALDSNGKIIMGLMGSD